MGRRFVCAVASKTAGTAAYLLTEGLGMWLSPAVFKTANSHRFCGFNSHSLRTKLKRSSCPANHRGAFFLSRRSLWLRCIRQQWHFRAIRHCLLSRYFYDSRTESIVCLPVADCKALISYVAYIGFPVKSFLQSQWQMKSKTMMGHCASMGVQRTSWRVSRRKLP